MEKLMNKAISLVTAKSENNFKISVKDFDPRENIKMTGWKGKRGGVDYEQPLKGWVRIGLKISRIFDGGNDYWLETDDNAWPVVYHGTKNLNFSIP